MRCFAIVACLLVGCAGRGPPSADAGDAGTAVADAGEAADAGIDAGVDAGVEPPDGGVAPCLPITIDLVAEPAFFLFFFDGCGCTDRFPTEGGCVGRSAGDTPFCNCPTTATSPSPSLTGLTVTSEAGVTTFPLENALRRGGALAMPRAPHGDAPVSIGLTGCWGAGEIADVLAGDAVLPVCDETVTPPTCTFDGSVDLVHVCSDGDVVGIMCCEYAPSPSFVLPEPTFFDTTHVSSVYDDGAVVVGNVTVRLWRSATLRDVRD